VVGDLACDPANPQYMGGLGKTACKQKAVSDGILADASIDSGLVTLGDVQYDCDDPADYAVSYDPTYGRLDPELDAAALGNHEYKTGQDAWGATCPSTNMTAQPFFDRFPLVSSPATAGHFSFDIGNWHLVVLNGNCLQSGVGGCSATSPQTLWLKADLAASTQPCTAAFWHQPLYQGLAKDYVATYKPWWDALIAANAEAVFNGHIHNYQRFAQMDSAKHSSATGLVEYVVGTGGEAQVAMKSSGVKPVAYLKMFGYLRLSLGDTGWHSEFVDTTGVSHDAYDGVCR
jgi:hypothetical protein